jgi:hypothetical protein
MKSFAYQCLHQTLLTIGARLYGYRTFSITPSLNGSLRALYYKYFTNLLKLKLSHQERYVKFYSSQFFCFSMIPQIFSPYGIIIENYLLIFVVSVLLSKSEILFGFLLFICVYSIVICCIHSF